MNPKKTPFFLLLLILSGCSSTRVANPRRLLPPAPLPAVSASPRPTVGAQNFSDRQPPPPPNGKPAPGGYRYDREGPGYSSEKRVPVAPQMPEGVTAVTYGKGPNSQNVEITLKDGRHIKLTTVKEGIDVQPKTKEEAAEIMSRPAKHFVETWR